MKTRWKLTIEYRGNAYAGWQRQEAHPSIQQAIEEAIERFSGQRTVLHVAGRTDAGVHARGQVAHVDLEEFTKPMKSFEVAKAINAYLRPQPISIISAQPVSADFHARFSAKNKHYRYRILCRSAYPGLEQGFVWHHKKPLDTELIKKGATYLLGHHDFTTFRDSQCQAKSPLKTIDKLDVYEINYDNCDGKEIIFDVEGKSFLHHMVRNLVGTLTLVGEGKWSPSDIEHALNAKDRKKGGPTAPAEGLYLMRVDYK